MQHTRELRLSLSLVLLLRLSQYFPASKDHPVLKNFLAIDPWVWDSALDLSTQPSDSVFDFVSTTKARWTGKG